MVRIRLKRIGRKKKPFYRIVVADIRERRECAPIAMLGYYNPLLKQLKLDKKAALDWIAKGAQPTETAMRLINKADESGEVIQLEVKRKEKLSRKAKAKAEADKPAEEAPAAAEEPKAEDAKAEEAPKEEAPKDEAPKEEAPKAEDKPEDKPAEDAKAEKKDGE